MIVFKKSWRTYKKGEKVQLFKELEERLIRIGKAERVDMEEIPYKDKLDEAGLHSPEQIVSADLTKIKGIGKATQKEIKDHVRNVYNIK